MVTLAAVAPFALLHPGEPLLLAPGLHGAGPGHAGHHGAAWWASPPPCSAAGSTGWSSGLTRGLRAVADGDFSQRLEPEEGGPLQPAYEDFQQDVHGAPEQPDPARRLHQPLLPQSSRPPSPPSRALPSSSGEPDTTPEERDQYLQIILDESSRLADLANSTLLLTKLESQQCIAGEAPLLPGRADQAVRHPPLPRLGEKADLLHRQLGAGGVRGQ